MSSGSNAALAADVNGPPADQKSFSSSSKRGLVLVLVIVAVVLVLYDPVKNFGLLNYDDNFYITLQVQQGLTWKNALWSFTTMDVYNWHPLTWISYFFDSTIFHATPAGFHYVNLLLHALDSTLLFLVLSSATGYKGRSFFVAALFAVHPFNVQSVAWVAERKNMLSTLFFLLALLAYRGYALAPTVKRYLLVALYFALGLMAKPMVITLPCVLLLWDFWPLHRWTNKPTLSITQATPVAGPSRTLKVLLIEKIPLLMLSAASAYLTITAQKKGGAVQSTQYFTMASRLENAILSYANYLYKTFWPVRFSVFYSLTRNPSHVKLYLAIALVSFISALALLRIRRQRYLAVGWLWYLGTLVPVIGIIQVGDQAMADRYAYVPLIGVFFGVVWTVADWTSKLPHRFVWLGTSGLLVLVALFGDSRAQLPVWKDNLSLWSHAVQVDDNDIAEFNYGAALEEEGRGLEGLARFALVADRHPNLALGHFNYASSLLRNQRAEEAILEYQLALRGWERNPDAAYLIMRTHYNLGRAYLRVGNTKAAEGQFRQTVQMDPSQYEAYLQLGLLYQKQNYCKEAMAPLAFSLKMRPSDAGFLSFGICLQQQGKLREASAAFREALKINPDLESAQAKLREIEDILASRKNP